MSEENKVNNSMEELESKDVEETEEKSIFCTKCGTKIAEGQRFCPSCGNKVGIVLKPKKIKISKKYIYSICAVLILVMMSSVVYVQNKEKNIQNARIEYLTKVKDFEEKSLTAGINLEDIADTIQKYWHENIYEDKHGKDIDSAILSAVIGKNNEIKKANEYDEELLSIYKELKTIPEGSEDLNDILAIINNVYNSYADFYTFAIEPTGNYNQYIQNNDTQTNKFMSNYKELSTAIKTSSELENAKSSSEIILDKTTNVMKQYYEIASSIDMGDGSAVTEEEKKKEIDTFKIIIGDFKRKKEIDVREIESYKDKFKNDVILDNAIQVTLSATECYRDMIKYADLYAKDKSQKNLEEFISSTYLFRAEIAMYKLHIDSLEDDESL